MILIGELLDALKNAYASDFFLSLMKILQCLTSKSFLSFVFMLHQLLIILTNDGVGNSVAIFKISRPPMFDIL